ncbi:class I SAM-dependent methyltransferase [Paenibacillus sp. TRM 82003]|nr:class I SAM-dependent methyltransferase [Paenibacillus sp. TRM 82003]
MNGNDGKDIGSGGGEGRSDDRNGANGEGVARAGFFVTHYDRLMGPLERRRFAAIRRELLGRASGRALELGCGTGVNFPLYPRDVRLTAIEPNALFLDKARERASEARSGMRIEVVESSAESLPFADDAFDTVVGTLVFCTIPDARTAVREMKRVCRPGGKLLLFEHVRHERPALAALQDALTPWWSKVCDGCHLNRATETLLKEEGIEIVRKDEYLGRIFVSLEGRNPL